MTELLNTLFITEPGTSLHLEGGTVRIYHPEQQDRKILPLLRIDSIIAFNGVTVTDDLLMRCADDDRPVTWMSQNGKFLARVTGPAPGNALLRLEQARAHDRDDRRLELARTMVAGKLQNSRQLLLRVARDARSPQREEIREVADDHAASLQQAHDASDLSTLLGVEGQAANRYTAALPLLSRHAPGNRSKRPPRDTFNCLRSFGYGLLRSACIGALEHVGLDPYIGYLHGTRAGKPSLALDLMEEFRALLVDRLVLTLVNRNQITKAHTSTDPSGAVSLTDEGRKFFLQQWSEARKREWHHSHLERDVSAGTLPLLQARLLAYHFRNPHTRPAYTPWIAS